MSALSFDILRDGVIHDPAFQSACQRYAHGNGSSEAIAMAVLTAAGFPDLFIDALRYRYLRSQGIPTPQDDIVSGDGLDQAVDAAMLWDGKAGA